MSAFPTGPVCVTGATGYVAGWIIRELLARGATVHGTARSPDNPDKVGHLTKLADELPGTLKLFKADLLDEGAFAEAMAGCEVVVHTASPFPPGKVKDPQKILIDPALGGTRNVLNEVEKTASVRRVVLTSSIAAVMGDNAECGKRGGTVDESHWNETSDLGHVPYYYSKLVAEQEAWKLKEASARGWELVTINPVFVMGPALTSRSGSMSIDFLKNLIDGSMASGVWVQNTGYVDVREVATAHVEATVRPDAEGRHILHAEVISLYDLGQVLKGEFGDKVSVPGRVIPKWLAFLIAPAIGYSWRYISGMVGHPVNIDNSRSIERLGIRYRPLIDTFRDHVEQLWRDGITEPAR